jgi:anti-sigma factor RsiW
MDRELIERLATDRALGALSADAGQLLDAYVQHDPAAAAVVNEIERTVGLARTVLRDEPVKSMPAFPVAGFAEIERWQRRTRRLRYVAGLAACVMVGLGLGRLSAPMRTEIVPSLPVTVVDATATVSPSPVESGGSFWSVDRMRQRIQQRPVASPRSVKWISPATPPRLGDAT